jgi:hypothetical protein
MAQAGNPRTNTRDVISITFPQIQRPVGRGRSPADGACRGFCLAFGLSSGFGSVIALGCGVGTGLGCSGGAGLDRNNVFGSRVGWGGGRGFGAEAVLNGRNASQDLVSALTCILYLTPACFAVVQLKTLSPFFGLKF